MQSALKAYYLPQLRIHKNEKRWTVKPSIFYSVENIGLEPMTSCMPCKRSSQLS